MPRPPSVIQALSLPGLALIVALALPEPASAQWSPGGTPVCTALGAQDSAVVVSDGAAGCFLAWVDERDGNQRIWAQHLDAGGFATWVANGIQVCIQSGQQTAPQIVSDGVGGCIIIWLDRRSGTSAVYGQRLNAGGSLQWIAAGVSLCTNASSQTEAVAAADGAGGVIAAWLDARGPNNVYAQRLDPNGTRVWNAAGARAGPGTAGMQPPAIGSDGAGGALIGFPTGLSGPAIGQRLSATGSPQWGADGVLLLNEQTLKHVFVSLVSDGSGGAYFAFATSTSNELQGNMTRVWRLDGGGAVIPGWDFGGAIPPMLGVVHLNFSRPWALTDGAGGVIVVTAALRQNALSGPGTITAHHVTPGGFPNWMQACQPTIWTASSASNASAVSDGFGGLIAAWSAPLGVSAIRLNSAGITSGWPSGGAAIADGTNTPRFSSMCADGTGGGIVVFDKNIPATGRDIYVSKVGPNGGTVSVEPSPAVARPGLALQSVIPNPTRAGVQVAFTLSGAGATRLELFDVQGRKVLTKEAGHLEGGQHLIEVRLGAPLPTGVYMVRLTSGGESQSSRFVVAH